MVLSKVIDNNRKVSLVFSFVVALLIADVMINYISDLIVPQLISTISIFFFTSIVVVSNIGMYLLIFEYIKKKTAEIRSKDRNLQVIHIVVALTQYSMAGILIFMLLEILLTSKYHTFLLIAIFAISQTLVVILMGAFALRFLSWFRTNKNSLIVLLYGLSFALTSFSIGVSTIDDLTLISQKSQERTPNSEVVYPYSYVEPGSISDILSSIYGYTDAIGFLLLIPATAVLLYHYSKRIGRAKFWVIVLLPAVYFLSSNWDSLFSPDYEPPTTGFEGIAYFLIASLNSTSGGILFGISLWTVGKTLRRDSAVRQYIIIAAYGFVVLYTSASAYPIAASYPPYGVVALSFLPLASYMIFIGIYSTAISISQDNRLRSSVKKFASENSNLLSSIGTAQMEQEIQKTVNSMKGVVAEQEKELEEQTGIEANLEEDEMKNYLEEVMQEVGKVRKSES